jgi:hypothetical protein
LKNASTLQRWADYGNLGTPTVFFDGLLGITGSADAYANYRERIENRIAAMPPIEIEAEVSLDEAGIASIVIHVEEVAGQMIPMPEECSVRAVLYENDVIYCCDPHGEMIWDHVARQLHYGQQLDLDPSRQQSVILDLDLDPSWVSSNLKAIAFVQRGINGEILNAAEAQILEPDSVEDTSWGRVKSLYR